MGREFKKVIPRKGLIVRYPNTKAILPEKGATVPWIGAEGRFWRRRFRDGDILLFKEEQTKSYTSKKEIKEENKDGDKF